MAITGLIILIGVLVLIFGGLHREGVQAVREQFPKPTIKIVPGVYDQDADL